MKRVLLKLSGEALAGDKKTGFDEATCIGVAKQVKELEKKYIDVKSLDEVPEGATVIFRAHGEAKKVYDLAKSKNIDDNTNYNGAISKVYFDGEKEYTLLIYADGSAKISVVLDEGPIEYPINNLKGKDMRNFKEEESLNTLYEKTRYLEDSIAYTKEFRQLLDNFLV